MTVTPAKSRGNLVPDFIAGLTTGVANIPDAMASGILAGVNPVAEAALHQHKSVQAVAAGIAGEVTIGPVVRPAFARALQAHAALAPCLPNGIRPLGSQGASGIVQRVACADAAVAATTTQAATTAAVDLVQVGVSSSTVCSRGFSRVSASNPAQASTLTHED